MSIHPPMASVAPNPRRLKLYGHFRCCRCGRKVRRFSPVQKYCPACQTDKQREWARQGYRRRVRAAQGDIVREDGWCWRYGWRDERLVELERLAGHSGWRGPQECPDLPAPVAQDATEWPDGSRDTTQRDRAPRLAFGVAETPQL
jgi:hypothetical protein